jgi:hypothetical protein
VLLGVCGPLFGGWWAPLGIEPGRANRKQLKTPAWFQKPLCWRYKNPLVLKPRNLGFCAFQNHLVLESRLKVFGEAVTSKLMSEEL